MESINLRAMSRRYAAGDIDQEEYRARRRELIRGVVDGTVELVAFTAPEPDAPTIFPYEDDDGDTTQEILPPTAAPASPWRRPSTLIVAAAIVLTLLVVAAVVWWSSRAAPPTPANTAVAAPPAAAAADAGAALIDTFLTTDLWDDASLRAFARRWSELPEAARTTLAARAAHARLGDAILAQLANEQALLELGDPRIALAAQKDLLDFARQLDITDARLTRAAADWERRSAEHVDAAMEHAP